MFARDSESNFITTNDRHTEHPLHEPRNEKCQIYRRCARLFPTPHRPARRHPLCNLEHHPPSKQWTTTFCKGSTYSGSSRSSRISSSSSSPPFTANYLETYVLSFRIRSLTDWLALLPRFRLPESRMAGAVHGGGALCQSIIFVEPDCRKKASAIPTNSSTSTRLLLSS